MKTGESAVMQKKVNNIPKNVSAIIFSPYLIIEMLMLSIQQCLARFLTVIKQVSKYANCTSIFSTLSQVSRSYVSRHCFFMVVTFFLIFMVIL